MPLILAIEPDRRQAAQLASIAQGRIGAELVLAESAERALRALGDRVPDLILTPPLLSPRDDAAITDRLRELGAAATHVQTLTIPALSTAEPRTGAKARGLLSALRRQKAPAPASNGCAPEVFADQIAGYLERALEARNARGLAEPIGIGDRGSGIGSSESPVATPALFDHDTPIYRGTEIESDDVAIPMPEPVIEPEWPVHVEATVTADVAMQVQNFWEPVHAESRVDTGVDVAIPIPERAIEPEWPVHVEVAVTADVASPVQDFWEPVHAESRVDTGVDVEADLQVRLGTETESDDVAILKQERAIEPEWPVHVEVAVTADVARPVQDFWEPVHAESRVDTGVDVEADLQVRLGTETESDDVAIPMPERAIEPEWPVHVEVALAEDTVALAAIAVEATATVEAATRTTEAQRHELVADSWQSAAGSNDSPLPAAHCPLPAPEGASVPLSFDHGSGHPEPRRGVWPVEVRNVLELTGAVDVAFVEAETPPDVTPPAWVETDLTELVDAIAEPEVDPEPEILETPQETPQPLPAATLREVPLPTPAPPKAAAPAHKKRRARPAPPKDDWHFFDPEETRFAALLAKLDEITRTDAASHSPRP